MKKKKENDNFLGYTDHIKMNISHKFINLNMIYIPIQAQSIYPPLILHHININPKHRRFYANGSSSYDDMSQVFICVACAAVVIRSQFT